MPIKKLFILLVLTLLSTPSQAVDIKNLEPNLHPLPPHHQRPYMLYDIHPVMGQYLTLIKLFARSVKEYETLTRTRGGPHFYAAAWFSQDWKLIQIGDGIYGNDYFFQTPSTDVNPDESAEYPPSVVTFPRILVRTPNIWDEDAPCPFIYVTPLWMACMNQNLEFDRTFTITRVSKIIHKHLFPMIIRQAFVTDGHLWIVGLHHGYLLHQYDWKKGKIQRSLLPLQHLIQALKNRGVQKQKIKLLLNSERPLVENPSDSMSPEAFQKQVRKDIRQASGQTYRRAYLSALRALPTSFQYQVALFKNRLFMIVRNPMTVAVWSFPEGKLLKLRRVREQDIPSEILSANQLYLGPAAASSAGFRVWFETDGPLTYQYLILHNSYLAEDIARRWRPEKKGPLTPQTVVGVLDRYYIFDFTLDTLNLKVVYHVPEKLFKGRWAIRMPPRFLSKKLFLSIFDYKDQYQFGFMTFSLP